MPEQTTEKSTPLATWPGRGYAGVPERTLRDQLAALDAELGCVRHLLWQAMWRGIGPWSKGVVKYFRDLKWNVCRECKGIGMHNAKPCAACRGRGRTEGVEA